MDESDPAAIAASTAQGWAHALNTVARPAPEHLEAAQEALTALVRHTGQGPNGRFPSVRDALEAALGAARARVGSGRPEVTVDQLLEALERLQGVGLVAGVESVPRFVADGAIAAGDARLQEAQDRIIELEEALEDRNQERNDALDRVALTEAEARRQAELRDRFEREAADARRALEYAKAAAGSGIAGARDDQDRQRIRWILAQLGMNPPGFDQMPTEELRETAAKVVGDTLKEAQALRLVVKDVRRAVGRLGATLELDGGPWRVEPEDRPVQLAAQLLRVADESTRARSAALARQQELEDQLADLEGTAGPKFAAVTAERDMLMRARDEQAAALRAMRDVLTERDERLERQADTVERLQDELARWTGAGRALGPEMEPGLNFDNLDGQELRNALTAAVRRQIARVSARIAELESELAALEKHHEEDHHSEALS